MHRQAWIEIWGMKSVAAPRLRRIKRTATQGSQTRPGLSSSRCSAALNALLIHDRSNSEIPEIDPDLRKLNQYQTSAGVAVDNGFKYLASDLFSG